MLEIHISVLHCGFAQSERTPTLKLQEAAVAAAAQQCAQSVTLYAHSSASPKVTNRQRTRHVADTALSILWKCDSTKGYLYCLAPDIAISR